MWPVDTSILLTRIECVSARSGVSVNHNVVTLCIRERIPSMKKTPRKAAQERKTLIIKIRVNVEQLRILQAAADRLHGFCVTGMKCTERCHRFPRVTWP